MTSLIGLVFCAQGDGDDEGSAAARHRNAAQHRNCVNLEEAEVDDEIRVG